MVCWRLAAASIEVSCSLLKLLFDELDEDEELLLLLCTIPPDGPLIALSSMAVYAAVTRDL